MTGDKACNSGNVANWMLVRIEYRTFEELAAVGLTRGNFEGDNVALREMLVDMNLGSCRMDRAPVKAKGMELSFGVLYLCLVQQLNGDTNCGSHGGGWRVRRVVEISVVVVSFRDGRRDGKLCLNFDGPWLGWAGRSFSGFRWFGQLC